MIFISEHIQLDPITLKDQSKLMTLIQRIYTPVYKHLWKNEDSNFYFNKFYSKSNLEKELSEIDAEYYFVVYKTKVVGIFRIHYNKTFSDAPEKSAAYFHRIYLGEEVHGTGLAKQLCDWAETKAKQKGNELIWLKVMDTQKQALRFYEKQGFEISNTTRLTFDFLHENMKGMYIMFKNLI